MKKAKILGIVFLSLMGIYLVFSLFFWSGWNRNCSNFSIVLLNDPNQEIISAAQILESVDSVNLNPTGRDLKTVNLLKIRSAILENPFVADANVFEAPDRVIKAEITTRQPVLRVLASNGDSYLVDDRHTILPAATRSPLLLPLATGYISRQFAQGQLCDFASHIFHDTFWKTQIEQINVLPNNRVELIPRLGNHTVTVGTLQNFEKKLRRLYTFYQKGLNVAGWNKYSNLNIEFSNQVVCTKKQQ